MPECTYPECKCPFDAPADPNWCAKGLPKPLKTCHTCAYHEHGLTNEFCTNPHISESGHSEPIFYAVLKCGPGRPLHMRKK